MGTQVYKKEFTTDVGRKTFNSKIIVEHQNTADMYTIKIEHEEGSGIKDRKLGPLYYDEKRRLKSILDEVD